MSPEKANSKRKTESDSLNFSDEKSMNCSGISAETKIIPTLNTTVKNDNKENNSKSKQIKKMKLKSVFDEITSEEKESIDIVLIEMIIANKIPFDVLQSKICFNLLHLLGPAYNVQRTY